MSYNELSGLAAGVQFEMPGCSGSPNIPMLSLYTDNSLYPLPLLPFDEGIRLDCRIISLDGKIYVLGGVLGGALRENSCRGASRKVYVFDPARTEQPWKRCASMQKQRRCFAVGAFRGKIYVFGGSDGGPVLECEVYDPKVNAWASIADMVEPRAYHHVAEDSGVFYVYGGVIFGSNGVHPITLLRYYPDNDEWDTWYDRARGGGVLTSDMFMINGCFHRFTDTNDGIERLAYVDREQRFLSWDPSHSILAQWDEHEGFSDVSPDLCYGLDGQAVMVGGELLTACQLEENGAACLLQTKGFSGEDKDIVLEIVQRSVGKFDPDSTIILVPFI